MSILALVQRIMARHVQIAYLQADLHGLQVQQGNDLNALSKMIEDGVFPCTKSIHCADWDGHAGGCEDGGGNPIEMAVHTPSTMPPNNGITHYEGMLPFDHVSDTVPSAADFAPDADCAIDDLCTMAPGHEGDCITPPASEVRPVQMHPSEGPAVESVPEPKSGVRRKSNPRTPYEWALNESTWRVYVASIRNNPRHVGHRFSDSELETLRMEFIQDHAIKSCTNRTAKPGVVFTSWLAARRPR